MNTTTTATNVKPRVNAGRAPAQPSRWARFFSNEHVVGYLFVAPLILGLLIFTYGPVLAAFFLSFTKGDYISTPKWIGLGNYQALLKEDLFWKSMQNTFYYVVGVVPAGLLLSLLLALAMNQKLRGIVFFRSIFFLPTITSSVAISLMWLWIYNPEFGVLNFLLKQIGIKGPTWLSSSTWAMPAIIIMSIWRGLGYNMLIYLAGLQGIPEVYYEAAEIDGAGSWAKFRHITLPLLSPVTFYLSVLGFIGTFKSFDSIYVMRDLFAKGTTDTASVVIFDSFRTDNNWSYSAAQAIILLLIILALTAVQRNVFERRVFYG